MRRQRMRFRRREIRSLTAKAVELARDHREVCGLLIDNGYFLQTRETRNISKRDGSFEFDMREINSLAKAAEKLNLEVVGTFHSHPVWFAEPGKADIKAAADDSLALIIDAMDRDVRLWRIKNGRAYARTFELI